MRGVGLLVSLLAMLTSCSVLAAPAVYFLSVGSSRYLDPKSGDDHGFQKLDGARNGAVALSERLSEGGARFGISLSSPEGTIVGLADVNRALDDILKRIAADKPSNPILVFYIAAHGISDGFAWNHFSVLGDLTYRGDPDKLPPDQLADRALYAAALVDRLGKAHIHYLLILDTCQEGKASVFNSPVLSATASHNIGDIAQALRFMNEFHQADAVLFSTTPGTTVPVAPDPTDPASNSMGPLARRLVILIDAKAAARKSISVADMIASLRSASADTLTRPAVTNATPATWWSNFLYVPGSKAGMLEERTGTATVPRLCCVVEVPNAASVGVPVNGTITLVGAPGDFITNGKTINLRAGITLERANPVSITLRVPDPDGDWELDFTVGQPFVVGNYAKAERARFAADDRPGLSVSGHAHGCNDVHGQFAVTSLPGAKSGALAMTFKQLCDDVAAPLTGIVQVHLP
jgi:hypothetical protein